MTESDKNLTSPNSPVVFTLNDTVSDYLINLSEKLASDTATYTEAADGAYKVLQIAESGANLTGSVYGLQIKCIRAMLDTCRNPGDLSASLLQLVNDIYPVQLCPPKSSLNSRFRSFKSQLQREAKVIDADTGVSWQIDFSTTGKGEAKTRTVSVVKLSKEQAENAEQDAAEDAKLLERRAERDREAAKRAEQSERDRMSAEDVAAELATLVQEHYRQPLADVASKLLDLAIVAEEEQQAQAS